MEGEDEGDEGMSETAGLGGKERPPGVGLQRGEGGRGTAREADTRAGGKCSSAVWAGVVRRHPATISFIISGKAMLVAKQGLVSWNASLRGDTLRSQGKVRYSPRVC